MLGKLLRHEMKATSRVFLPFFGVLLVFAGVNKLFLELGFFQKQGLNFVAGMSMFTYVILVLAVFVLTYVVMIQRFYKNLLGDEGYLMFTLPVKPSSHILAKLFVSTLWMVLAFVAFFLSLMILLAGPDMFRVMWDTFSQFVTAMNRELGVEGYVYIVEFLLMAVVSLFYSILMIYAAIAIGHTMKSHKVLSSFAAYLILNMASQMILLLIVFAGSFGFDLIHPTVTQLQSYVHVLFIGSCVIELILAGACYFITRHIFTRKLNLE